MPAILFFRQLGEGLLALGTRRLIALALAGLAAFVTVAASGYYLSRPQRETLYSGLDPQDVSRIGAVLDEAGIAFDVSVAGDAVLVDYGGTARARMLLAQKGLPKSDGSGYELFDKMGSLGLTSFMQQVTRVRALEGELARTIQQFDGIKAARVHLALRNEVGFRNSAEKPTASVVIRTASGEATVSAAAIRHLVAAAIPGLAPDQVSVMTTDGNLLSATDDPLSAASEKLLGLERTISADLQQKVERTLAPYLGLDNFRVSVVTKLNADRRQINETTFDPNSRVERSTRTIKESGEAQNAAGAQPVSVQQNTPQEVQPAGAGDTSHERKDHREELTNYEINSKSVATTSEGYGIDHISVAVVVNKAQVLKSLGEKPTAETISAQLSEIEQLAASAAGLDNGRGDRIKISAVDFLATEQADEPPAGESLIARLAPRPDTLINAAVMVVVSLLILFLGLRPALKAVLAAPHAGKAAVQLDMTATPSLAPPSGTNDGGHALDLARGNSDPRIDQLAREVSNTPQQRLAKIVELDPERAAHVLKQWLNGEARTPA